jgi:two-component system LytT family sensor kinase
MRLPPRRTVLLGVAFATALGLVLFGYRYLDVAARGRTEPFAWRLIEELTSAYGIALLVVPVAWWVRRVRARAAGAVRRVLLHVPALVAFSVLHTSWNAVVRPLAFLATGQGRYDYGILPVRYAMEFWIHIVLYAVIAGAVTLLDERRAARERETRLARMEADLNAARLEALEARLHPHFLFNALNTISSVMYEDVQAADRTIARLAELLRSALRTQSAVVPLGRELDTVRLWVDVMRARFADRLDVRVDVPDAVRDALVPPLLLQPLLENAVKHGDPGPGLTARIGLRARRTDDRLVIDVTDNGPGLRPGDATPFERGIGLRTTKRRLEVLYGDDHRVSLMDAPGGGANVHIDIPWRTETT